MIVQAPEDGTDVVAAAKRVLKSSALESLGLQDKRDIAMLIAQSALQVRPCCGEVGSLRVEASACPWL